jgi:hypothetical protein
VQKSKGYKMITPPEAVTAAVKYLISVIGEVEHPQNFTIEKISTSKDKKKWTVVIGYDRQGTEANSLSVLLGNNPRRFKAIELDATTGDGISLTTFNPDKH